jgi:hypothetical protein
MAKIKIGDHRTPDLTNLESILHVMNLSRGLQDACGHHSSPLPAPAVGKPRIRNTSTPSEKMREQFPSHRDSALHKFR